MKKYRISDAEGERAYWETRNPSIWGILAFVVMVALLALVLELCGVEVFSE